MVLQVEIWERIYCGSLSEISKRDEIIYWGSKVCEKRRIIMRDKVLVIGSLNYDIILKISKMPEIGENMLANSVTFRAGGKGANQAVQTAKLGMKTYMAGCVGKDAMGDFLLNSAKSYGVNVDYIRRTDMYSGMAAVNSLDDGGVFATIAKGANFEVTKEDIDRVENLMDEAAIVIFQMEIPQDMNRYAIDKAKAHGCKVLMNAAPAATFEEEYIRKCDIFVVNEVEAGFYAGKTIDTMEKAEVEASEMSARFGNTILITMGKEGAVVASGGRTEQIPALKVKAVETTGAGDSFIGATSYALMNGMDIFEACSFATRCSAVTVCNLGAQESMPTLEEVKR